MAGIASGGFWAILNSPAWSRAPPRTCGRGINHLARVVVHQLVELVDERVDVAAVDRGPLDLVALPGNDDDRGARASARQEDDPQAQPAPAAAAWLLAAAGGHRGIAVA